MNPLTRLLRFGRRWAQNLAYFLHRIRLRIANDVAINSQRDSRIRMSHLSFRDCRIRSYIHQQPSMAMPKRVHTSAFNLELVEDRPKAVHDNFVRCIGSPFATEEERTLEIRSPRRYISQILTCQKSSNSAQVSLISTHRAGWTDARTLASSAESATIVRTGGDHRFEEEHCGRARNEPMRRDP